MEDALYDAFCAFAAFGAGRAAAPELDGARFVKLAKDSGLIDKGFTTTSADLIFARVKEKGARKIGFDQFLAALDQIAATKYPGDASGAAYVVEAIVTAAPRSSATARADTGGIYSKLTDHTLYTGAHKERFDAETGTGKGLAGRDAVAVGTGTGHVKYHTGAAVTDLSQITRDGMRGGTTLEEAHAARVGVAVAIAAPMRPSTAGARSAPMVAAVAPAAAGAYVSPVGAYAPPLAPPTALPAAPATARYAAAAPAAPAYAPAYAAPVPAAPAAATPSPATALALGGAGGVRTEAPPRATDFRPEAADLYAVFMAYCAFGATSSLPEELDNARFAKLCRECGLVDGRRVTPASVDIAFSSVKDKGKRTIRFEQFIGALAAIGKARAPGTEPAVAVQAVVDAVISAGGPALVGTAGTDTSTGIYARLTDHRGYTGAHKERFDADTGAGRGRSGRDAEAGAGKYSGSGAVHDLSQITRPNLP